MRTRRNIYIIIGSVLILLNLLIDIGRPDDAGGDGGTAYNVGYFIGGHFLLIIGVILLITGYRLHKKIKAADRDGIESDIRDIGKNRDTGV